MRCAFGLFSFALHVSSLNVHVIAYNRTESLQRCLHSLSEFFQGTNDAVNLTVSIDGPHSHNQHAFLVASTFKWSFGQKQIIRHESNIGIPGQWNSIQSDHDFMVVEDDVELASRGYQLLIDRVDEYRKDPELFGISLTNLQWQLGINERKKWRRLDMTELYPKILSFPAISTWAQIVFADRWQLFRSFSLHGVKEPIEGSIYEKWYKENPRGVWSRHFQLFVNAAQLSNVYFNLAPHSLAVHHREPGANTSSLKGPSALLLTDFSLFPGSSGQRTPRFDHCLDPVPPSHPEDAQHPAIHRNHACHLRSKRMQPGSVHPLDYDGTVLLWTERLLRRHGHYHLGAHGQCNLMKCPYMPGLYPHHR